MHLLTIIDEFEDIAQLEAKKRQDSQEKGCKQRMPLTVVGVVEVDPEIAYDE